MAKFKRKKKKKFVINRNKLKEQDIRILLNQAIQHHQTGEIDLAIKSYQNVLKFSPSHVIANHNLGLLLHQSGDKELACNLLKKAISYKPDFVEAHFNLGNFLVSKQSYDEAIQSFQQAIALKPNFAEAYINLGNTYRNLKHFHQAAQSYKKAISFNSNLERAHFNLANTYKDQGLFNEAAIFFQNAINLRPDYAESYNNLGVIYKLLGRNNEAIPCYKKVVELIPDYHIAHNNLGNAYKSIGLLQKAICSLQTAIKLQPDYAEAHNNLGSAFKHKGDCKEALSSFNHALHLKPDYHTCHSNLLLTLNYTNATQREIFEQSKAWFIRYCQDKQLDSLHITKSQCKKVKVGYVSPDFKSHSVAYFFEPLIMHHNKKQFEIYCYANVIKPDKTTERIKHYSDHWQSLIGWTSSKIVKQIQEDGIDILVDLAGHTADNCLQVFSQKPAPIQISWLGYPNTTGLDTINYRFTDFIADPISPDDYLYSEELYRLDNGFLCYQADQSAPDIANYSPLNRSITYGCFNNFTKVTNEVMQTWAEILSAEPSSRLLLKSTQLVDEELCQQLKNTFSELKINSNRIELYGKLPKTKDHFDLYNNVDIALDPFPYNGTTTTFEALWMGVPVITLRGNRHSGRVGASIMHHLNVPELIAESKEDYVQKALDLAQDSTRLAKYRHQLRPQLVSSPLCDAQAFAFKIETAYRLILNNNSQAD